MKTKHFKREDGWVSSIYTNDFSLIKLEEIKKNEFEKRVKDIEENIEW